MGFHVWKLNLRCRCLRLCRAILGLSDPLLYWMLHPILFCAWDVWQDDDTPTDLQYPHPILLLLIHKTIAMGISCWLIFLGLFGMNFGTSGNRISWICPWCLNWCFGNVYCALGCLSCHYHLWHLYGRDLGDFYLWPPSEVDYPWAPSVSALSFWLLVSLIGHRNPL